MPNYREYTTEAFLEALASGAPTPGGGGASALTGALAAALDGMVCALAEGKPRYDVAREIFDRAAARCAALRRELLALVDEDACAFAPLRRAYAIPKDDPARPEIMESALHTAAEPPLKMLRACAQGIALTDELTQLDPLPAATDAGCAAALFGAALDAAALNLRVNTKSMHDRAHAGALNDECDALLAQYRPLATAAYARSMEALLQAQ